MVSIPYGKGKGGKINGNLYETVQYQSPMGKVKRNSAQNGSPC